MTRSQTAARLVAATAVTLGIVISVRAQTGDKVPGAEASAQRFLIALVAGDKPTLESLVPAAVPLRFGAYPFAGMPGLTTPSVTSGPTLRAYVPFNGGVARPGFPHNGIVYLHRKPGQPWLVKHISWYDDLPGAIVPPTRSDRNGKQYEGEVEQVVRDYLNAWKRGDYPTVQAMTYDWLNDLQPLTKVTVHSMSVTSKELENGEVRIDVQVKVRYDAGVAKIPYRVDGFIVAVLENETWKIQPYSFAMP